MKSATKTWVNQPVSFTSETILITLGLGIALAVLPLPSEAQTNCAPVPSGIVSWWRAEGDATDQTGSNNGTLVGNTTFGSGRVGQAFVFDGSGDAVSVGNPTNLQLQTFTIEAWVKRGNGSVVSLDPYHSGGIFYSAWGGYGLGLWDDGRLLLTKIGYSDVSSSFAVTDTTSFHHVAVTKTGSTVVFYLDGVGQNAGAYDPGFEFNGPSAIGARGGDYAGSFLGAIDEVSVYNRDLSAVEVQAIYAAGGSGKCFTGIAPSILSQPSDQTTLVGNTASFSVSASGTPPLNYQWRLNGTNINGATSNSLVLLHVQTNDAGVYSVMVSNASGMTNSSNATLTVKLSPSCTAPPSGLVSWWRAEGNGLDQTGTNNGTLVGNTTFGTGRVGQAFVFDGSGDAVSVGNPPSLQLQTFTIEAWVKRGSGSVASLDPYHSGGIFYCAWGGYGLGLWDDGRLLLTKIGSSDISSTFAITDTTSFHHVAVTKTGSTVVFYLDGVGQKVGAYDPGFEFNGPAAIGARGADYAGSLLGTIDEVSVYNRALSTVEIQAIYNAGGAGKCVTSTPPPCATPPSGLVSWWRAEGNGLDQAGTNNGTLVGNTTFGTGRVGQAFVFDGSGDAVSVGNPASLQLQTFTVEAWIKRASATVASLGSDHSGVIFEGSWGSYAFGLWDDGRPFFGKVGYDNTSPTFAITDTTAFHHVAVTKTGSTVVFYLDGVAQSVPAYNSTFDPSGAFAVGARGGDYAASFLGSIDEVSVYSRALSTAEIQSIYNAGGAGKCVTSTPPPPCATPPDGLVSWWRGEGNSLDQAGSDNGTLVGNTTFGPGRVGQAFVFDGSGDAVSVGNPANLQLQNFTIEAWVARGSTNQASFDFNGGVIFSYGTAGYGFALKDDGRMLLSKIGISEVLSAQTISDTSFHHLAVTKNGTTVLFYIDGTAYPAPAFTDTFTFSSPAAVGAIGGSFVNSFIGSIDEVSVYSRALSAAEIQAIYNADGAGKCLTSTNNCTPAPSGLVSWWQGNGDATDAAGTNSGFFSNPNFASGEVAQAFSFNGSNYVYVHASPSLDVGTSAGLTVEAWINPVSLALQEPIIEYAVTGAYAVHFWANSQNPGQLYTDVVGTDGADHIMQTSSVLAPNVFQHVAFTYDKSSGVGRVFVNGVAVLQQTLGSFTPRTGSDLYIGYRSPITPFGPVGFRGQIDEVSLYSRALTTNEIQAIYNAASAGKCRSINNPPCTTPPSGLVSWWRAEGNGLDQAGSNNGTLIGNTTFGPGRVGQAFVFDGSGDAVAVGSGANLQLQNFTIEAWIKRANLSVVSLGPDPSGVIFETSFGGYGLGIHNDGTLLLTKVGESEVGSSHPISDTNNFHHLAVTKNGSTVVFYLDGVAEPVGPYDPGFVVGPAAIGARGSDYAASFLGSIDEVSVYNRALSASEVQGIYNADGAGKCVAPPSNCAPPPAGLISWWPLEGNGNDVADGNSGTVVGNVSFVPGEVGISMNCTAAPAGISISNSPILNFGAGADLSIEAWVQPVLASTAYDVMTVVDKRVAPNDTTSLGYELYLGSGKLGFLISDSLNKPHLLAGLAGPDLRDGVWHHVAGSIQRTATNGGKLYVDGQLVSTFDPTSQSGDLTTDSPLLIGLHPSYPRIDANYRGLIDEVSLYGRALSASEILAIYTAAGSGKCRSGVGPTAPAIFAQPASQTVTAGANVTFSVGATGTSPLTYQWRFNTTNISGATASSLILPNVQLANGGQYSVAITNSVGFAISSNATLTVNPGPTVLRVPNANAQSGASITIPVLLTANGAENALSFSLSFVTSRLSYASAILANGAGATLFLNESQTSTGRLGVAMALPAGATFPAGAQELVEVTFTTGIATNDAPTTILFADQPIVRQVVDAGGNVLPASYLSGTVSIAAPRFEADVSPRPNGDRAVTVSDWVVIGRFAAHLDIPANGSEFQRADCAPRANLGDGRISITDWVQAGRYAAGLDPLTIAGGPTSQVSVARAPLVKSGGPTPISGRQIQAGGAVLNQGQSGAVSISLQALGDENALGFTVIFDPAQLTYTGVSLGSGATAASLNVNTDEASAGRLGFALALSSGHNFAAGLNELVKLTFQASVSAPNSLSLAFADEPIYREVSDSAANALTADYVSGTIVVNPLPSLRIWAAAQGIGLAWPSWATNFILQQADGGAGSMNWTNVSVSTTITNNESLVIVPTESSTRFYRLLKQ